MSSIWSGSVTAWCNAMCHVPSLLSLRTLGMARGQIFVCLGLRQTKAASGFNSRQFDSHKSVSHQTFCLLQYMVSPWLSFRTCSFDSLLVSSVWSSKEKGMKSLRSCIAAWPGCEQASTSVISCSVGRRQTYRHRDIGGWVRQSIMLFRGPW